jgi:hypothetical protein
MPGEYDPASKAKSISYDQPAARIPGPDWVQLHLGDVDDDLAGGELPDPAGMGKGDPECACRGGGALIMTRPFPADRDGPFVVARCESCAVFPDNAEAAMFVNALVKRAALGL